MTHGLIMMMMTTTTTTTFEEGNSRGGSGGYVVDDVDEVCVQHPHVKIETHTHMLIEKKDT